MSVPDKLGPPNAALSWGLLRLRMFSGVSPEQDEAHWDGWYHTTVGDALQMYESWCREFPGWTVALILPARIRDGEESEGGTAAAAEEPGE